jgi:hypothetical protein
MNDYLAEVFHFLCKQLWLTDYENIWLLPMIRSRINISQMGQDTPVTSALDRPSRRTESFRPAWAT